MVVHTTHSTTSTARWCFSISRTHRIWSTVESGSRRSLGDSGSLKRRWQRDFERDKKYSGVDGSYRKLKLRPSAFHSSDCGWIPRHCHDWCNCCRMKILIWGPLIHWCHYHHPQNPQWMNPALRYQMDSDVSSQLVRRTRFGLKHPTNICFHKVKLRNRNAETVTGCCATYYRDTSACIGRIDRQWSPLCHWLLRVSQSWERFLKSPCSPTTGHIGAYAAGCLTAPFRRTHSLC